MAATRVVETFKVCGKVQKVMFRQTAIRAASARGLEAGATNTNDKHVVHLTLAGVSDVIEKYTSDMKATKPLNSWGAEVESIEPMSTIAIKDHQVTCDNVDNRKWNPNITFFFK